MVDMMVDEARGESGWLASTRKARGEKGRGRKAEKRNLGWVLSTGKGYGIHSFSGDSGLGRSDWRTNSADND